MGSQKSVFNSISSIGNPGNSFLSQGKFHAGINKQRQLESIDEENARLYAKLKSKRSAIDSVTNMK